MSNTSFMDAIRSFFGFNHQPPTNDFRNPIWGSDDDDDGDELYGRQQQLNIYEDPMELHIEMTRHLQDMFKSFGGMFNDVKLFSPEADFHSFPESFNEAPMEELPESNLRDYYLKPGYENSNKKDTDLDGKISSNEISGLLKRSSDSNLADIVPFDGGNVGAGKSFFQTIITTRVTKPDGSVETRRIVKDGKGVVEDTTTRTVPEPTNTNMDIQPAGNTYNIILPDLSSFVKIFN